MGSQAPTWPVVLWDFDGTIVDSVSAIVGAHHVATEQVLGIRLDETAIRERIGEPAHRRIARLVPERSDEVYAAYCVAFDALTPQQTPVFLGVPEILDDLAASGATNALVTSRPRDHVLGALEYFGLGEVFATVVALDDTTEHKPHAEPLLRALSNLTAPLAGSVYVGDAVVDIESAIAAGTDSIAVTWGAGRASDLLGERPTILAETVEQLSAALGVGDKVPA